MGKKVRKNVAQKKKLHIKNEILKEDRVIKSLEKKLKLNKRSSKTLPKSFVSDGLDYILDICDEENRKLAAESEKRLLQQSDDDSDDLKFYLDKEKTKYSNENKVNNKQKTNLNKRKTVDIESFSESNSEPDEVHISSVKSNKKNCKKNESNVSKNDRLYSTKVNLKKQQTVDFESNSESEEEYSSVSIKNKKKNSKQNKSNVSKDNKLNSTKVNLKKCKPVDTESFSESNYESEEEYSSVSTKSKKKNCKQSKFNVSKNNKSGNINVKLKKRQTVDSDSFSESNSEIDDDGLDDLNKNSAKKQKNITNKKVIEKSGNKKQKVSVSSDNVGDFNEEEENFTSENSDQECNFKKNDGIWEDIYGRKRNKDGSIVEENKQKYIPPALRLNNNSKENEKLLLLKRQIKGLLNRLGNSGMHTLMSQLEDLYMSNSRNDMNEIISSLMIERIIVPEFVQKDLIVSELMMCMAVLHANVDTQVGAHFIMTLIKMFNEITQKQREIGNKELDNLILMISHLYNFKVFGSQLIYQILNKLIEKFTEKEIDIILLLLKTAGFKMRKDNPLALKELILNVQKKAAAFKVLKSSEDNSVRIQCMLDILLAIKNNNMSKIPQYDQSHMEQLKKVLKTLVRKGNSVSQLNLSFEDLINADQRGKWWIVGSAWSGKSLPNNKEKKSTENKPVYSQKILKLAQAQRMNTDVRKNIFCILMTAEDYLDAFEKLHHLGLKDRQEREIIYVILNCCLQEQNFNPYYAVVLQKFCECDRKYQMTIQYTLWDKLKILNSFSSKQVINLAKLMSYLFIQKALPLSILKVIQLGELDALTMKLFRKIMLDVLLHENLGTCLQVFERIASSEKLHQFREGLRLFINYFLLKNLKKETVPEKQVELLKSRVQLVDKVLITSSSKVSF